MTNLPLTLTCADYPRILLLATGAVQPKGIDKKTSLVFACWIKLSR